MDRADARVVERRSSTRFLNQPCSSRCVGFETLTNYFDGDCALKLTVVGAVHGTHTARTQLSVDAVMTEHLADHGLVLIDYTLVGQLLLHDLSRVQAIEKTR